MDELRGGRGALTFPRSSHKIGFENLWPEETSVKDVPDTEDSGESK